MKPIVHIIRTALLLSPLAPLHAVDAPTKFNEQRNYSVVAQLPPNKAEGYFMAPSLAKLPNGTLVAAAPLGLAYPDGGQSLRSLRFYRSTDGGSSWKQVSELPHDSCEPNLFVHQGRLYLLITPNQNNSKLERSNFPRDGKWGVWVSVSDDEGVTWSPIKRVIEGPATPGQPAPQHGTGGQTAMLLREGRLYLSVSDNFERMAAVSCRLDQGILDPQAWKTSEMVEMPIPSELVHKLFKGASAMRVLEGNVVEVSGRLLVIARAIINGGGTANMGAVFEILDRLGEPLRLEFLQFYPIPGGQMKFYIQHDEQSALYWMASNLPSNSTFLVANEAWSRAKKTNPWETDRRSLTLWYSVDSLNWFPAGWVARTQDWTQAFHYPVMLIDGEDLILVSRTGRDSGNQHDVDMVTFHRVRRFRDLAVDLTPTFPRPAKELEKR